ncbi:MAG: 3-phosphoshikimate 1-carboxyvinyltransferase [Chloroflexi bacterium]|nr:3-phosphoshikimate 1-carboxyvinyltransferase [Chloroflexota bacterium]
MKASVYKSQVKGKVRAPSSKSYTVRGLMCAALAAGTSQIVHPLGSDDTDAASDVLGKVGVHVAQRDDLWEVAGGNLRQPDSDLFCGDSAATLRFMTAICSLVPGRCRLTAGPSLSKRPVRILVDALRQWGVDCSSHGEVAPVVVEGGRLRGGVTELPGNVSSQFISALLLVAPFAEEVATIRLTTPLESKPFVAMTLECLQRFGVKVDSSSDLRQFEVTRQTYRPVRYTVEGDWSSASYFLALGAMCGEVEVGNLNAESLQGDKALLGFLRDMGASVTAAGDSVTVKRSRLKAILADLSDYIDLLPTMAVLAAVADGTSRFAGIDRARLKESDRVAAVREGLERMGIKVVEEKNRLAISGGWPRGSVIDTRGDHRIAMAFGILGLAAGDTAIQDAECVSKTFPGFWETLKSLGGEVETNGK